MKITLVHDLDQFTTMGNKVGKIDSYHNLVTTYISTALVRLGHKLEIYGSDLELEYNLKKPKPDLAFNTSIRRFNNSAYAYAPGILEKLKIPYTGPSALACSNAYDKQQSNKIMRKAGVNVAKAVSISLNDEINKIWDLKFPIFVKPQKGGCSQGISRNNLLLSMHKAQEKISALLEEIGNPVIVEEFLPGREFTVGILGNQPPKVLPILEFTYKDSELPFRSYSRKMINYEVEDEVSLAVLNEVELSIIEKLAINAFKALDCKDYARIDIRLDAFGIPAVLEVNAIPNLHDETSSFGLMVKYAGITFDELIAEIVNSALNRYSITENA